MTLTRRDVFSGMAGLAIGGMFAKSAGAAGAELQGKSVRIATYGGSWRDAVDQHFASPLVSSGVNVEFVVGNPDDNLAKAAAARRTGQIPFDVMDGSSLTYPGANRAGFFEALDYSRIPGSDAAPAWAREEAQVTVIWAAEGIVYNEKAFADAGLQPPQTYLDLKDPKLKGKVAFPAPGNVHHWAPVVALAREAGGSESDMDPAVSLIQSIGSNYYFSSSAELATRFGSGDIWAAPLGAGWAVRLKKSGLPINVSYPKIGDRTGSMWPGPLSVLKDTPNVDAAYAFLAEWFKTEGSTQFCLATGSVPVPSEARRKMAELAPEVAAMLLMDDDRIENSFRVDWASLDAEKWRATWNSRIQG
ncbi:MAG: extracellular solute-binding protein [Nitratireductor sp.]|nr:extracellular solute-binding protein [Nitratireductor sp.]